MRLIDADLLLDFIKFDEKVIAPEEHTAEDIVMMIQTAPTITPPPNDPLTLEELREMDGEPVFIKRIGSDHPDDREWALVDSRHSLCKTVDGVKAFFEFFGKSWFAYRRKPEGADRV